MKAKTGCFLVCLAGIVAVAALGFEDVRPAAEEKVPKAGEVLARAQRAVGGPENLRAIRDISKRFLMTQAATGATAGQRIEIVYPSSIRLTSRVANVDIVAFCCDGQSWAQFPMGTEDPLPDWQQTAALQDILRQLESLLLSGETSGRKVEYEKSEEVDSRLADVLVITDEKAGPVRLWVDRLSGEPLRLSYQRITPSGRGPMVTDLFSDYRPAGKLRLPFKITSLTDGDPYMETVVEEVTYNTGLTVEALAKRAP